MIRRGDLQSVRSRQAVRLSSIRRSVCSGSMATTRPAAISPPHGRADIMRGRIVYIFRAIDCDGP